MREIMGLDFHKSQSTRNMHIQIHRMSQAKQQKTNTNP